MAVDQLVFIDPVCGDRYSFFWTPCIKNPQNSAPLYTHFAQALDSTTSDVDAVKKARFTRLKERQRGASVPSFGKGLNPESLTNRVGMATGPRARGSTAWMRHQIVQDRIWRIIDAKDQVLGRLATQISHILQGKHKPMYLDNMFCGDPVIVINARHFALTGRKRFNKQYIHHSGYPGGLKKVPIAHVMEKRPKDALRLAVKGMLPANRLRAVRMANLRIFLDDEHDHQAQNPVPVPPAHCGPRLGYGGPPTYVELEHWWTENLLDVPDHVLNEVVAEVRAESKDSRATATPTVGLAQLLEIAKEDELTAAEPETYNNYASAADKHLREDAVIIPASLG